MKKDFVKLYTVFIKKYRFIVFGLWLVLGIVGMVFVPKFIDATSSEFNIPQNAPSYIANQILLEEFPEFANTTDFVILIRSENNSVINNDVRNFVYSINETLVSSPYSEEITEIESYFFYLDAGIPEAAYGFISSNNRTTIIVINYSVNSEDRVAEFIAFLRKTVKDTAPEGYIIGITGELAMFEDMKVGTERDLIKIDAIIMPIALVVIGLALRSFRLLILPLISIFLSMAVSFFIMYFIALAMPVFSFVPSVMMVMILGMSIDYALFLLSRFREEMQKGVDFLDTMVIMLKRSGHTISMSALILIFSFLGLAFFPVELLATMGIGTAVALTVTLIVNLTFVPSILFIFSKFFSKFYSLREIIEKTSKQKLPKRKKNYWKKLGKISTKYGWIIIIVVFIITIPVSVQVMNMNVTMDYSRTIPRHADSMTAYNIFKEDFNPGVLGPMYIVVTTNETNGVLQQEFFDTTQQLITTLANRTEITNDSFVCISMAKGQIISHLFALMMLDPSSPLYNSSQAAAYRLMFEDLTNADNSSAIILVQPNFDPFGDYVGEWVVEARKILDEFTNTTSYSFYLARGPTDVVDTMDIVYSIFPIVIAIVLVAVYILMAIMTKSLIIPLTLIITIALTISWIYGLASIVFVMGLLNFIFPSLHASAALYWATPVMSFTILIGLGLDYDVFLLTRIIEFREEGYKDKDAIMLGLEKTGTIINIAGVIMAVAFSGLIFSSSLVMNEFGFILCIGVLLDTFVVRTLLVPSMMAIAKKVNWWPSKKPEPTKELDNN